MGKRLVPTVAVAICLISLTMGCTIKLTPGTIPRLDATSGGLAGPFNNISVTLVNAQPDNSDYSIKDWKGRNTGYLLSRKLWTEKLSEALATELTARQGRVVGGAPVTISLKITGVIFPRYTYGKVYFDATASVTSNSGWTKTYVGKGDAATVGSRGWNRAANWMITDLVRVIMSDREFVAEVSKQK